MITEMTINHNPMVSAGTHTTHSHKTIPTTSYESKESAGTTATHTLHTSTEPNNHDHNNKNKKKYNSNSIITNQYQW